MNKAIFLDRDGTINVEKNYLHIIIDFEFLPGVVEALQLLQKEDYMLIIITNQSGIGRGYYSELDFQRLTEWMINELKKYDVVITDVFYCPHLPNAAIEAYRKECMCRKPKLGMYKRAIEKYNIDLSKSFAVGDKIRDCAICQETECRGFLLGNNEAEKVIKNVKLGNVNNVAYADDLLCAAKEIIEENRE